MDSVWQDPEMGRGRVWGGGGLRSAAITLQYLVSLAITICFIVQELCESRGGRPGLSVLTSLLVSVDANNY